MKVFSLFSTAILITCLTVNGFCEVDSRESQLEEQMIAATIAHGNRDSKGNGYNYQKQPSSKSSSMNSPKGATGDREIRSVHGCISGFSVGAEFLWWRAQMDNLQYAIQDAAALSGVPFLLSGRIKEPDFEFNSGVRVSAGYDFGKDNWDIFLRWTYQHTDATDSTGSTADPSTVFPLKDLPTLQGFTILSISDTARVKWQNQLNVLDFETGYDYFLSQRASLRPFFGVKVAWLNMDYHATYGGVIVLQETINSVGVTSKTDFWGVGPMVGMDGYLHIGWGFSLYAQTSTALIYGKYSTRLSQSDSFGNDLRGKQDDYMRQRAIGIIAIGLEWVWCFSDYLLALNLGWEGQYWWNQYELIFPNDLSLQGDLTYTGLNAGVRFDF